MTSTSEQRPPLASRARSPAADSAVTAPEAKKQRPSVEQQAAAAAADNSDDEKSDQDLVVDEVNDVRIDFLYLPALTILTIYFLKQ